MAMALTFVSCDMDKEPYNAIPDEEALLTPTDFLNMSTPLYTGLRGAVYGSAFCNAPDIQSDDFNSTFGTGVSDLHGWTFSTSLREGESMYASCQGMIANANFIIDGYNKCDMSNPNTFTEEGIAQVRNVKGEAFFTRAKSTTTSTARLSTSTVQVLYAAITLHRMQSRPWRHA